MCIFLYFVGLTLGLSRPYGFLTVCFQVVALKKAVRELEQKVQDQEEELDDQAGQIQMLDQVL